MQTFLLRHSGAIRAFLSIFLALMFAALPLNNIVSADGPPPDAAPTQVSKVSSALSLRVAMKKNLLAASNFPGQIGPLLGMDPLTPGLTTPDSEQVFLYFAGRPTQPQLSDLETLGVTPYPDSWIPPVGNHPDGFILADMPVGQLDALAAKDYILSMDTAEETAEAQNDSARAAMGVAPVWSGGDTGAGVTVAVLDSGIDTSNPDFPHLDASNSKDYSNYPALDDTIANIGTGHGTHVTGSVLGRGVNSNGTYAGVAPGANLVFLKIGTDATGGSGTTSAIEVAAIKAAVDTYHAKIITMSYGGWSQYHDGSDAGSQAVDYAVSQGSTMFVSAGNEASKAQHYSGSVPGNSTSSLIQVNLTGGSGANTGLGFNLVWYDGLGSHNALSLKYYDASQTQLTAVTAGTQSESSRGTESVLSAYNYYVGPGTTTYYLRVQNSSPNTQSFHIYYAASNRAGYATVAFSSPDPGYTLDTPAEADSAIAVGAYVSRAGWTDYKNSPWNLGETQGTVATFSSRGPRVDGGAPGKPEIVAPGSAIISVRDPFYTSGNSNYDPYIIDNDGQNLNGSGPANYYVMEGTSMACPLAAGVGALLLSKNPSLTPAQVKSTLETTATDKGTAGFDNNYGWGLVNASAAVNSVTVTGTKLAFGIQPGGATAGLGFATQPVVTVQDANGNTVTGSSAAVTLSITSGTGTSGAVLSGTTTVNAMAGIATFSGLGINVAGSGYTLTATSAGLPSKTSASFSVAINPLSVTTNPANADSSTTAILNGNLTGLGTASSVQVSFEWGPTAAYGNTTTPQTVTLPGTFSAVLTGLTPGSPYHFHAKAVGSATVFGADATFVTQKFFDLNFTVTDAVITNDGQYLYATSKADQKVYIVNLTSGTVQNVPFAYMPESIAITPAGDAIYIAELTQEHQYWTANPLSGYIAQVNPANGSLVREFHISDDPGDIAVSSDGYLYIAPGSNQWGNVNSYSLATGSLAGGASSAYMGSPIAVNPSGNAVYLVYSDKYLSPTRLLKYPVSAGNVTYPYNWPMSYHGVYSTGHDLKISPDGTTIFTQSGEIFSSNNDQAADMIHLGSLGTAWNSLTFDGLNNPFGIDSAYSSGKDTLIRKWDYSTYTQLWSRSVNGAGRFVFYKNGRLIAVTDNGDYAATSRVYVIPDDSPNPTITTTTAASNIAATGATLNGKLSLGTAPSEQVSFEWGTTNAYGNVTVAQTLIASGTFSANLNGLTPNAVYHFRATGIGTGILYGDDMLFSTQPSFLNTWGTSGSADGQFNNPAAVAVDGAGNVYVADSGNNRIEKFNALGIFVTKWGTAGSADGQFSNPQGLAVDTTGNVYVADFNNARVQKFSASGTFLTKWGTFGSADGQFYNPIGVTVDSAANVYVTDLNNGRIQKFSSTGTFLAKYGQFSSPRGVAVDGQGNVYVADSGNCDIQEFSSAGTFLTSWGTYGSADGQFNSANAVAVDGAGNVYVGESFNGRIQKFSQAGTFLGKWGGVGSAEGQFSGPSGLAIDGTGKIYVSDGSNNRIQVFGVSPPPAKIVFTTLAQSTAAGAPSGILTIQTQDAANNPANAVAATQINLTSSSATGRFDNSAAGPFDGTVNFVTVPVGSNSVSFYYKDVTAGTPTITCANNGLTSAIQQETVSPAAVDHYAVSSISSPQTAGTPFSVTIHAQDAYNNNLTTGSETVNLTFDTADAGATPVSAVTSNGAATVANMTMTKYKFGQSITFTGVTSGKSGKSNDFDVLVAGPSRLVFGPLPSVVAGAASPDLIVQVADAYGNLQSIRAGTTVNLTSSSATGRFDASPTGPFDGATHSVTASIDVTSLIFYYKDTTTGTPTITVASSGLTPGTQQETVIPASASQVRVETAANGGGTVLPVHNVVSGGSVIGYAVERDQFGNFVASVAGTWSVTNRTGGVVDGDLVPALDGRSATFTGHGVGSGRIHAVSGLLNPVDSGILTVVPGTAARLNVTAYSSPVLSGAPSSFTVIAKDTYGNTVPGYTGTVHFTSSDSIAFLPPDYTFVGQDAGTHTFSAMLVTLGVQSIIATDTVNGAVTGTQTGIQVNLSYVLTGVITGSGTVSPAILSPSVKPNVAVGGGGGGGGQWVNICGVYAPGTVVRLTAAANGGWAFKSWTGDATSTAVTVDVTMTSNKSVTANFVPTGTTSIASVKQIPALYDGFTVNLSGAYKGWRSGYGDAPVSKNDWVIDDGSGGIYVTGSTMGLVFPRDDGKSIKVTGTVRLKNGLPYIELPKTPAPVPPPAIK